MLNIFTRNNSIYLRIFVKFDTEEFLKSFTTLQFWVKVKIIIDNLYDVYIHFCVHIDIYGREKSFGQTLQKK
jgi:hypothetical protein